MTTRDEPRRVMGGLAHGDRYCRECGWQLYEGEGWCPTCGHHGPARRVPGPPTKRTNRAWVVVGLAALLLVGVFVGFLIYSNTGCRGYRSRVEDAKEARARAGLDSSNGRYWMGQVEVRAGEARAHGCSLDGTVADSVGR